MLPYHTGYVNPVQTCLLQPNTFELLNAWQQYLTATSLKNYYYRSGNQNKFFKQQRAKQNLELMPYKNFALVRNKKTDFYQQKVFAVVELPDIKHFKFALKGEGKL